MSPPTLGLMLCAAVTVSAAQERPVEPASSITVVDETSPPDASPRRLTFDPDHWALDVAASSFDSRDEDRPIRLHGLSVGLRHFIVRGLAIHGHLEMLATRGTRLDDDGPTPVVQDAATLGLDGFLTLRWHALRQPRWSLYIDRSLGIVVTRKPFPPSGTSWNFVLRGGFGATFLVKDAVRLVTGVRRLHISNGKGFGHPRNPAYSAWGGYVGIELLLPE